MGFIGDILDRVKPQEPSIPKSGRDSLAGFGSMQEILLQKFDQINQTMDQADRMDMLIQLRDMSREGAIADKALEKLCEDATANEVSIDAPKRRKTVIQDLLDRTNYQEIRKALLYIMLRDGDLFNQIEFTPSINPTRIGYITRIMIMPSETMIRNTNERDEFDKPQRAFAQVDNIQNALLARDPIYFSWPKIVHARNDPHKGKFFRYGWSMWASGIKIFNMAMMMLEDSAIARHLAAQRLRVHRVGKESTSGVDESLINQYKENFRIQYSQSTSDVFIDGKNVIDEIGGTKQSIGSVDDLMMALSVLSIAVEYPIDLLSGMINRGSGGEELFRKEVVLKRAIQSIIKKENQQILQPIINRELLLAGSMGDYRINTFPTSFEDENKKSKRGLGELQALVKAPRRFHEENNDEVGWEEELALLEEDLKNIQELVDKYPEAIKVLVGASGRKDPQSGTQGSQQDTTDQQERKTPGQQGTDEREEGVA
jgi:hypothetical protein